MANFEVFHKPLFLNSALCQPTSPFFQVRDEVNMTRCKLEIVIVIKLHHNKRPERQVYEVKEAIIALLLVLREYPQSLFWQ